jgi:Fic family protein
MSDNQPPYTITSRILSLVAEIIEELGKLSSLEDDAELRLRRINKIKTVHGSLAIEGNTLDEEQISAIIDGKRVLAAPRDLKEANNAVKVYNILSCWNPNNEEDLLSAHGILMDGLLDKSGAYRHNGVGITDGTNILHMAPPADRVPYLMHNLFEWLQETDVHPLIVSSVFHYEFEFIHPFADGNGRMGRLWQTLILSQWHPSFMNLPVENMIYLNQSDYYIALNKSTAQADSSPFIKFMLEIIKETIKLGQVTDQVTDQVSDQVRRLVLIMNDKEQKAIELMKSLKLSHRPTFRKNYLNPAITHGFIEMTVPDKPNSRLQKYRLTNKGKNFAK